MGWQLQRLDVQVEESTKSARVTKKDAEADDMDEEDFMREVEADREMRRQMNMYKSKILQEKENESKDDDVKIDEKDNKNTDDVDDEEIMLEELLDGLDMDDGPDPEDANQEKIEQPLLAEGEKAAEDGINYVGREDSRLVKDKDGAIPQSSFGKEYNA